LNLNGKICSDTRDNYQSKKNNSASAATIYKIESSTSTNVFTLEYKSNKESEIKLIGTSKSGSTSFAVEAMLWPQENIFKYVNKEDFEIKGAKTFTDMEDDKNKNNQVELVVNNDKSESRNYIITYNVATKLNNEVNTFGTVLRNKNEVEWTTIAYSQGKMLANHAARVVSIPSGESKTYSLKYVMEGNSDSIKMENSIDENAVVSLNAI